MSERHPTYWSVVILILVALLGGFLVWSNRKDPPTKLSTSLGTVDTTSWQIFSNDRYGYTFKYPASEYVDSGVIAVDAIESSQVAVNGFGLTALDIDTTTTPLHKYGANQLKLARNTKSAEGISTSDEELTEHIIDGKQAFGFSTLQNNWLKQIWVFVDANGMRFRITLSPESHLAPAILSTLSFVR